MAIINGGAAPDFLTGTGESDTINGLGANDRLNGNPGADTLNGGDGDDLIYDGILSFSVGDGSYTHSSDQQGDTLNGGNGDDQLFGSIGDSFHGGAGFDRMSLSLGFGPNFAGLTIDMRIVQAGGTIFIPGVQSTGGGFTIVPNGAQISGIEQVVNLSLTEGADTFYGTASDDLVDGGNGDDQLFGMGGDDTLRAGTGANTLDGGDGNDVLESSFGPAVNTMLGGAGDDRATLLSAGSSFDGGSGFDQVALNFSGVIDLSALDTGGAGTINGNAAIRNVEQVSVSAFGGDITFAGSSLGESVVTFSGVLNAHGGGGDDVLTGGFATPTADLLFGEDGDDRLFGNGGDDTLDGGAGDDVMAGGDGTNILRGGAGVDLVSYSTATALWVDLAAGVHAAAGVWDVFQDSIEGVIGGDGGDTLFGDGGGNYLYGALNNDTLAGRDGDDLLSGGAGNDWMSGDAGDDVLEGGQGVNVLIGGAGIDLASYAGATAGVWVDMSAGIYSADGVWDVFQDSIDGVRGGEGDDSLLGNALANRLEGGLGADALIGGQGDDTLVGEDGQDWIVGGDGNDRLIGGENDVDVLTGGAGADTFDLGTNAGWDVAFDFNTGEDRFALGGQQWLGFVTYDADGDGQEDDTLLGYAGGNFVALNVSGLTLAQWNALVDGVSATVSADKGAGDDNPEALPAAEPPIFRGAYVAGASDHSERGFRPDAPVMTQDGWDVLTG